MVAAIVNVGGYVTEFSCMFATFLKLSPRVNIVCGLKGKATKQQHKNVQKQ